MINTCKFFETFQTLVDKNEHLDEIQKFNYLLDCLEGDAKRVIESLEVKRENYTVVCELLEKRFLNKSVSVNAHLKGLIDMQSVPRESYRGLRILLDTLEKHFRALKALGETVDTWDRIIIFLMTRKLDSDTEKEWEEKFITDFKQMPKYV